MSQHVSEGRVAGILGAALQGFGPSRILHGIVLQMTIRKLQLPSIGAQEPPLVSPFHFQGTEFL